MLACVLGTKNLAQFGGLTWLWQAVTERAGDTPEHSAERSLAVPSQLQSAGWGGKMVARGSGGLLLYVQHKVSPVLQCLAETQELPK